MRLLNLADVFVAKMAPRTGRSALSALGAAKSLVLKADASTARLRPAMAAVMGFYPPGTYVQLVNGETAVVIKRGERATTPHVASLVNAAGLALSKYIYRDTRDAAFAVQTPLSANHVKIKVNLEKVRRLRQQNGV
jgi:hypothetical protein